MTDFNSLCQRIQRNDPTLSILNCNGWNLGSQLSVYGIAGGSRAFVKVSGNGGSVQEDDNGLSYGAGIKVSILRIEYMSYLDTSEIEADVVSVGMLYTFD